MESSSGSGQHRISVCVWFASVHKLHSQARVYRYYLHNLVRNLPCPTDRAQVALTMVAHFAGHGCHVKERRHPGFSFHNDDNGKTDLNLCANSGLPKVAYERCDIGKNGFAGWRCRPSWKCFGNSEHLNTCEKVAAEGPEAIEGNRRCFCPGARTSSSTAASMITNPSSSATRRPLTVTQTQDGSAIRWDGLLPVLAMLVLGVWRKWDAWQRNNDNHTYSAN